MAQRENRRGSRIWLLSVACAAASFTSACRRACPLTEKVSRTPAEARLAEGGRALCNVVVAPSSSVRVRADAGELADYLGRISGASFEVVEGDGTSGIAVGVHTNFPALATGFAFGGDAPFLRDRYALRSHADGVWLLGASEQAVTHAVWDLLRRLGYRLFFLTDTWEVVPDKPDLRVAVDAQEKPDYVTRQAPRGSPWSNEALWRRWRARNRVDSAFSLSTGHAYDGIIRACREEFDRHPEYRALVNGERRGSKFCIANPGLRKLVVDYAVRAVKADPRLESVSADPSDGGGWCECKPRAELGSVSDRAITLANEVAEAVNRLGLGPKYVGIYA